MKLSIIFSTYNRDAILEKTLQGLSEMDTDGLEWEIVLVDNAGNAETARIASRWSDVMPLTFLVEKKPGKNNALNRALDQACGELLIFTDDDVVPDPGWAKSMVEAAARWPDCDLFGGRILPVYPADASIPPVDDSDFRAIAYVIADWDLPEGRHCPVTKIWGPNMMVRRRVFDRGLRFDPEIGPNGSNYVMGSEMEFLKRARAAGYVEVYVPSSLVYHQIRPEQLTRAWLLGRAFRLGRMMPYQAGPEPDLKLRKWMLRELARLFARYAWACAVGSESDRLDKGIRFHRLRGHMYQCVKGRK